MRKNLFNVAVFKYLGGVILLAGIYHLGARLGLLMANVQPNTSPVWPPTGIAIAALLLFGIRYWPGVTLGVFLGFLLSNNPLNVTVGLAVGNTLETVAAVVLLTKVAKFSNKMDHIQDVISLAVFGALATALSATFGVITLLVVGSEIQPYLWTIWFTWWIGDFLGALVIAPLLLVWATHWPIKLNPKRILEGAIVVILLLLVMVYVFTNPTVGQVSNEALVYVIFPFILYAALRFTQLGAVISMALVSGIAIYGTATGVGPLVRSSINESLILLQTFLGVVSLTSLTLAAATTQRQDAELTLRHRVEDLVKLNDSYQTFLGIFETSTMYEMVCQFAVEKFDLDAAWIELVNVDQIIAPYQIDPKKVEAIKAAIPAMKSWDKFDEVKVSSFLAHGINGAVVYLPLSFGEKPIGRLALLSKDPAFFTSDLTILLNSYANLAAVAIQNTWLLDQVKSGNDRLHALSHRLMKVQETERLNLSRELHDESGQVISAMMVQLGLLERDAENPVMIRKYAQQLKHIASDVLSNLHEMAVRLRPASLDHLGLVTALEQYIADFGRQHNLDIQFEAIGVNGKRHSIEIEIAFFRVVQESLMNVSLHANATRVDVLLNQRKDSLNVIIEDNGVGFVTENVLAHTHLGLFGMRERVEMLGGTLSIESGIGKGTTIQVEVPVGD